MRGGAKDEFVLYLGDEDDTTMVMPTKFEVCGVCEGKGTHVNPSIDCNGISARKFHEDPEFAEMYFGGAYDVACYECKGDRVVKAPDLAGVDEATRGLWLTQVEEEYAEARDAAALYRAETGQW